MTNDVALVTGASSGIGAEMARILAGRKIDLVISARRKERLAALREELESQFGVRVTQIENDLDAPDGAETLYEEVRRRELPISMLINNAGFGYYSELADQPIEEVRSTLRVNVLAATTLTRRLAAAMCERRRGYILNVASFAALVPIPRYAVYSGAKAYVVAFSQALAQELKPSGVRVSVLCPGFTASEFHIVARHHKTRIMRWTELDPRYVAKAGIAGMLKGRKVIIPGLGYKLLAQSLRLSPRSVAVAFGGWMTRS